MFNENDKNYYPEDIAAALMRLAKITPEDHEDTAANLEDALYHLMACAQNEYNAEYFIKLWRVLQAVCDHETDKKINLVYTDGSVLACRELEIHPDIICADGFYWVSPDEVEKIAEA